MKFFVKKFNSMSCLDHLNKDWQTAQPHSALSQQRKLMPVKLTQNNKLKNVKKINSRSHSVGYRQGPTTTCNETKENNGSSISIFQIM
jgi:hypothetical protein